MKNKNVQLPSSYPVFFKELAEHIIAVQNQTIRLVNQKLIDLYWHIGKKITEKLDCEGWGKSIVEQRLTFFFSHPVIKLANNMITKMFIFISNSLIK